MRPSLHRRGAAAVAVAAVVASAACKVDVDGAPCTVPGAATECPSGQACGNDRVCSARAAGCAARCDAGDSRCDAGAVVACTNADPVCGAWERRECGAGLVCVVDEGVADCGCAPGFAGPEFAVDPASGPRDAFPFPTGAPSPAQCRFGLLREALQAAAAVGSPATVKAYGSGDVVFGDAETNEQFPLVVPANVTLEAADLPASATIVRATAPTSAAILAISGQVNGFRIESLGATGAGLALSCGSSGRPTLGSVAVDGGGKLAAGIDVAGSCGAVLTGVDVSSVAGPALQVRADAFASVAVVAGRYHASLQGIVATGGKLAVGADGDPSSTVEVTGNVREGVLLETSESSPIPAAIEAALFGARVSGNGGTGVVLDDVPTGSKLAMRDCVVSSNGAVFAKTYGPGFPQRGVGGILVRQGSLAAFEFRGNRIFANAGDQLAFETSAGSTWSIDPGACGPASNAFGCVAASAYAVAATAGTVDASFNVWPEFPWNPYAGPNVTVSAYCNNDPAAPLPPACPAP